MNFLPFNLLYWLLILPLWLISGPGGAASASAASSSDNSAAVVTDVSVSMICIVFVVWIGLHFVWRRRDVRKIDTAMEKEEQTLLNATSVISTPFPLNFVNES